MPRYNLYIININDNKIYYNCCDFKDLTKNYKN